MKGSQLANLFNELRETLFYIDQWTSPSQELLNKLTEWIKLDQDVNYKPVEAIGGFVPLTSEQTDQEARAILRSIYWLESELQKSKTVAEKMVVLAKEKKRVESGLEYLNIEFSNPKTLGEIGVKQSDYLKLIQLKEDQWRGIKTKESMIQPIPTEDYEAYERVLKLFKEQPFWVGSLSGFVYVMDQLARHGFLKANDLEEVLAESFRHIPVGKKKGKKITANDIRKRRAAMKRQDGYNSSDEIRNTTTRILNELESLEKV